MAKVKSKAPTKVKAPAVKAKANKVVANKVVKSTVAAKTKVSAVKATASVAKAAATKSTKVEASVKMAESAKAPVSVGEPAQDAVPAQRQQSNKVSMKGVSPVKKTAAKSEAPEKPAKKKRASKADLDAEKPSQLGQKWSSLYRKTQEQPAPYNMRQAYEAKTPIMHKLLGWGYIMTNKNDRLEVLFKDGIRYLISNYKS